MSRLYIAPTVNAFRDMYTIAASAYNSTPVDDRNSGFDLFCNGEDIDTNYSKYADLVGQGCRILAVDADGRARAYWLAPRSSISKTPWRLANSMGLMDATYRGIVKAALTSDNSIAPMTIHGQRLVQVVSADLIPWTSVTVVDELPGPMTTRGEGGFGSTGS
jgi:dUTPase